MVGGKFKRKQIFCNVKILLNSNVSVTNTVSFIGKEPCSFSYIFPMAAFALQGQSEVVATETLWPTKP